MKISFHGAARTVTGSKHLITLDNNQKILLDCGMFQGMGSKTEELNEDFGFHPAHISFLLLSHAHIDHTGLIPLLVKKGFEGKIFCTEATRELTEILLFDSAEIQTYDVDQINKIRAEKNLKPYEPLYNPQDVKDCLKLFETVPYDEPVKLSDEAEVIFNNAGHLIGSASIHLTVKEGGSKVSLLYSGDVGRYLSTLLQPPAGFPHADYLVLESTYGKTTHKPNFSTIDPLLKFIQKTCIDKKGKLIIPAFSVGRTQEVLYALNQLELENRLPPIKYFVDSPLAEKATEIIKHHMEHFNERLQKVLATDDDPFDFEGLKYIETVEESKKLVAFNEPCVIISASGMGDAGRVRHHIFDAIGDQKNTILFVGYCQEDSLGGQLLRGVKTVSLFGTEMPVKADIKRMHTMSAHGDSNDLIKFISCQDVENTKAVFLVHGELQVQQAFASKLELKGFRKVVIPTMGQEYELKAIK